LNSSNSSSNCPPSTMAANASKSWRRVQELMEGEGCYSNEKKTERHGRRMKAAAAMEQTMMVALLADIPGQTGCGRDGRGVVEDPARQRRRTWPPYEMGGGDVRYYVARDWRRWRGLDEGPFISGCFQWDLTRGFQQCQSHAGQLKRDLQNAPWMVIARSLLPACRLAPNRCLHPSRCPYFVKAPLHKELIPCSKFVQGIKYHAVNSACIKTRRRIL
jgi:hypothetical protein